MNSFTYDYPVRNYFGEGAMDQALDAEMGAMGKTVMLAYGGGSVKRTGVYGHVVDKLTSAGKRVVDFGGIMPNPTYEKCQEGAALAREEQVDFILAVGGGSVFDCCKVVSAQAMLDDDIETFEHADGKIPSSFIPMGCIVTLMESYFGSPRGRNVTDDINLTIQRNVIRNMRIVADDDQNLDARSELVYDSAMAENGVLKIGKSTDFQAHMIQHQYGAYTHTNHGMGLAVIHPALYRHLAPEAPAQFARWAREVWDVDAKGKDDLTVALEGIDRLQTFIGEMGLPTSFAEMGSDASDETLHKVADTCVLTGGCAKKLERSEVFQILTECL